MPANRISGYFPPEPDNPIPYSDRPAVFSVVVNGRVLVETMSRSIVQGVIEQWVELGHAPPEVRINPR